MSDQTPPPGNQPDPSQQNPTPPADPLANLKAEFSRKMQNLEATNQQLARQLASISKPAAPAPSKKPISELIYENPEEAISIIKSEVKTEIQESTRKVADFQQTMGRLYEDYPELSNQQDPLYKRADEILQSIPEHERQQPMAIRAAVREAASELGVRPKSKREPSPTDDFTVTGSGGGSNRPPSRRGEAELDPATIEFAQRCGLNTNDPELIKRLKGHASRKNWNRYE